MTRRAVVLVMLVGALLVPTVAFASLQLRPTGATTAAAATATPTPAAGPTAASSAAPSAASSDVRRVEVEGEVGASAAPTRVRIPSLDIDSSLESLRTDRQGRLQSPQEWQQAGWFADGTVPGDVGPAVVAGHADSPTGPAAFTGLDRLQAGDVVEVERTDGTTVRFAVDRTETVAKGDFPTDEVYGPTPDAQLRLITCDGPYVRSSGGYQDNLVVYASLVDDASGSTGGDR